MRFTQRNNVDFPGAAWADHHDDLARGDREVDPIDNRDVAEDLGQAVDLQQRPCRHARRFSTNSENQARTEMITR